MPSDAVTDRPQIVAVKGPVCLLLIHRAVTENRLLNRTLSWSLFTGLRNTESIASRMFISSLYEKCFCDSWYNFSRKFEMTKEHINISSCDELSTAKSCATVLFELGIKSTDDARFVIDVSIIFCD
jgi:hypothetical protein